MKGLVIAGTHSGCGKTTISMGIMAALERRGIKVAPFKVGPDFIDPGFHTQICGYPSRNLDGWMLSKEYNKDVFYGSCRFRDLAVVEGVMGLFDGHSGRSEAGSTAEMAKWLSLPVLLIVDARSMARSAAALIYGFENFDEYLKWAGVLLNRLGGSSHIEFIREAIEGRIKMPLIGGIVREDGLSLPERHLGLVTQDENPLSSDYLNRLIDLIEGSLDIDSLLSGLPEFDIPAFPGDEKRKTSVRIGIARDEAFCFYYQDNFDLLERYGAELVFFSPLRDRFLPPDIDGLYFGGGYPELFADALSENRSLAEEVRRLGEDGLPIYAECGGFMYLTEGIEDKSRRFHPMAGIFPVKIRMLDRLKSLGYREVTLRVPGPFGSPGVKAKGHEFHYSEIEGSDGKYDPLAENDEIALAYELRNGRGSKIHYEGYMKKNVLGGYIHLHFGSNPRIVENFIEFIERNK
jgi:cobyrinic acid a,c-diamide synthase